MTNSALTIVEQAREIAAESITSDEGVHLHAYPDSRSPMGLALRQAGIDQIGRTGIVPASVEGLSGDPWTIGKGLTGPDIRRGTVWSQQHADARFAEALVEYHDKAERAWPGMKTLHPAAQAALISLAYNRGTSLKRDTKDPIDRRREMRELVPAVVQRDYLRMAELIDAMTRIWAGEQQGGLLTRRKREADLCRRAARETGATRRVIA